MAEIINIASLTIDVDDVIKKSASLKKQLESLKKEQKGLKEAGEESSEAFIKNDVAIRQLSKSYRDNQALAVSLKNVNEDLNEALETENKSTQELRDSRRDLNQISKNIKGDTEEEIILRDKLNKAIDEQTDKLRGQGSEFNKSKDRVGEYKDNIIEAVQELTKKKQTLEETQRELEANQKALKKGTEEYDNLSTALVVVSKDLDKVNKELGEETQKLDISNTSLTEFVELSNDSGGASKVLAGGIKTATTATKLLIKQVLIFIGTPLGLLLGALAVGFLAVKTAMDRSESSTNKVKKAISAFTGIAKLLFKIIEPLGEFLIDVLVDSLEKVEKGLNSALKGISEGLDFLGFEGAAKSVSNFAGEVAEASKASKELTAAEAKLIKAQRESQKIQLDYQRAAEKLRQLRDNDTQSIPKRITANKMLGDLLNKQANEELRIKKQALSVAKLRAKIDGETRGNLDAIAEAEIEISDVLERIEGQRSEQLTNENSLRREAAALAKEAASKAKELADKKAEAEAEANEKKKEEALKAAEESIEIAKYELSEYIRLNKSKLDSDKFLTDEAVKEEQRRLNLIADEKRKFAEKELENGQISQIEYNTRINEINEENISKQNELELERKEAKKEQEAIDFENELILKEEQNALKYEIQTQKLEQDRLAEVASVEKTGADIVLINKKYAALQKKIDQNLKDERLNSVASTFGGVSKLLGEATVAGKAAGIAQATINTYQGVTEVLKAPSVLPEPLGTISKVVNTGVVLGSGLQAVNKIKSTKLASGGMVKGAGSGTSDSIPALLSNGESINNARSTSMFAPIYSHLNVLGGGKAFASGGIAGASNSSSLSTSLINYDLLADRVSEANKNLDLKISIEEIREVESDIDIVENLATSS